MEIQSLAPYEHALKFRALRNQVLSSNIANADTPNYKARDISFADTLKTAGTAPVRMATTNNMHKQALGTSDVAGRTMYRVPIQPSLDGNTVETDVEQSEFAANALQYRTSLAFLDGALRTLKFAIRGSD